MVNAGTQAFRQRITGCTCGNRFSIHVPVRSGKSFSNWVIRRSGCAGSISRWDARAVPSIAATASSQQETAQIQRPQRKNDPKNWDALRRLHSEKQAVEVQIAKVSRNGAIFELEGVQGYIPYSYMDFTRLPGDHDGMALEYLNGKTMTVKLVTVDEAESRLVGSELAYLTQQLAEKLQEGDIVEGVVSQCRDFGAFVKLGSGKTLQGVEGLIHISELSWNKIFTPEAVVQRGDFVRCKVMSADAQAGKINLSLKRMEPDPLEERLDTVLDAQSSEKVAAVRSEVPSSIEDILSALEGQAGVETVSLGRQAEERRAVSQDLEIWMSTADVEDGFALVARAGRLVQEINIKTRLGKDEVRRLTETVLKELASR